MPGHAFLNLGSTSDARVLVMRVAFLASENVWDAHVKIPEPPVLSWMTIRQSKLLVNKLLKNSFNQDLACILFWAIQFKGVPHCLRFAVRSCT